MPAQRGVARRTFPRRRTRRTIIKSGYPVYVRRFKKLLFSPQGKGPFLVDPPSTAELDWELWVLDKLEQEVKAALEAAGIPEEDEKYYLGFLKRLWERSVHFAQATFSVEKESLITEYVLRGWDEATLRALQVIGESWAHVKGAPWLREPQLLFFEQWTSPEPPPMNLLFSEDWQYGDPIGLELKFSEDWYYTEPPSMTLKFTEAWSS